MASQSEKKLTVDVGKSFSLANISPRDDSLVEGKEKAKAQTAMDSETITNCMIISMPNETAASW